jgi:hypothetical protein
MYHDGMNDIIGALGAGKNRMYIIPSYNTVVLRQTRLEDDRFDDHTFLSLLLDRPTNVTGETPVEGFSLYPTVAKDEITVTACDDHRRGTMEIMVYNVLGRMVKHTWLPAGGGRLPVHDLPCGLFFLRSEQYIRSFIRW